MLSINSNKKFTQKKKKIQTKKCGTQQKFIKYFITFPNNHITKLQGINLENLKLWEFWNKFPDSINEFLNLNFQIICFEVKIAY